jgi:hypothetical protein
MATYKRSQLDAVILAVASGETVTAAAASAQVSDRTARRWLARPEAKAKLAEARDLLFRTAVSTLAGAANSAAVTLRKLLNDKSPKVQLMASRLILEIGASLRDHLEIAERLAEIERRDQEREQALDDHPLGVIPRRARA